MIILEYPNWKQRLPFDNDIYKDVKRYTLRLNTLERELTNVEIDYYRSRFSLEQVMRTFKTLKKDSEKENFIKAVLKRGDNILYLPDCLVQYYKDKIKKEFKEFSAFFEIMLDKAQKANHRNDIYPMYKALLGNYYKVVMSKIDKLGRKKAQPIYSKRVKSTGYDVFARDLVSKYKLDVMLGTIFGRCSIIGRLPIAVVDDYGMGEWISKKVSYATDKFFLYTNHKSLTENGLDDMVLYNVYPGKAHFYNRVLEKDNGICFDNGANILINGWASYASCHSKSLAYSYSQLTEKATMARFALKKNLKKGYESAWVYIMSRYPKDRATQIMVDIVSFPGNYLSSIIGHMTIEEILKTDFAMGPNDFLDVMANVNCGNYLGIYHPKVQTKLAETSITAKVSKHLS